MHLLTQSPEVVQVSLAVAAALSAKFGGCALPILEEGSVVPKSSKALGAGVKDKELASAVRKIDKAYQNAANNTDSHIPSPVEILERLTGGSISKFFTLEITGS